MPDEHDHHGGLATAVLEMRGVQWATEKAVVESVLSRRPGVLEIEANPVAQTATVTYDPATTSIADLSGWIRDCGYHCAGRSVPDHICDLLLDSAPAAPAVTSTAEALPAADVAHAGHGAQPS